MADVLNDTVRGSVAWRDGYSSIRERFQRSVNDGALPPETNPALLATLLRTTGVEALNG